MQIYGNNKKKKKNGALRLSNSADDFGEERSRRDGRCSCKRGGRPGEIPGLWGTQAGSRPGARQDHGAGPAGGRRASKDTAHTFFENLRS